MVLTGCSRCGDTCSPAVVRNEPQLLHMSGSSGPQSHERAESPGKSIDMPTRIRVRIRVRIRTLREKIAPAALLAEKVDRLFHELATFEQVMPPIVYRCDCVSAHLLSCARQSALPPPSEPLAQQVEVWIKLVAALVPANGRLAPASFGFVVGPLSLTAAHLGGVLFGGSKTRAHFCEIASAGNNLGASPLPH